VLDLGLSLLQYSAASGDGDVRFILDSPDDNVWDQLAYACVEALVALDTVSMSRGRGPWSTPVICSGLETCLAGRYPGLLQEAERKYQSLETFLTQERTWFVVYWNGGGVRLRVENMPDAFQRAGGSSVPRGHAARAAASSGPVSHHHASPLFPVQHGPLCVHC
jgi:hypothetical protein